MLHKKLPFPQRHWSLRSNYSSGFGPMPQTTWTPGLEAKHYVNEL